MTMVRERQNLNGMVVEADRRAPFAPTVASWCPPLDLWYTMGVRESAKQQRTDEKMFRPSPNGEDDAPQPVLTDDHQREAVCSDEDGMKLLSADPPVVSDCILMKRFKSNSQKRLHFGHKMAMESYEDEGSCNMIALSAEEIAEDLMKMTGKMPSRNGNRKRLMLKGYFPAERTKMLQWK